MSTPTSQDTSSGALAPNYFTHTFPNGLKMIGQRMPSLSSVTFGVQVPAGIREEPEGQGGLAYLLAEMLFQGTTHRDVRQLTEDLEAIGARAGGEPGMEWARYYTQVVANRFDRALELLSDVLLFPTIPDSEFEQMRAVQLQDIRRRDDEPMRRIFDVVREHYFTDTPLARRGVGTKESVEALTPEDLRAFWRARYHPRNALFVIAGNFDWDHVVSRVTEMLGGWQGTAPEPATITVNPQDDIAVEIQEGKQEHIGMAFPFPKYGDPDYYAASLVSEIFGGGMASRLFREVREKRGLVYSVSSSFAPNGTVGVEYLYAGTTPEKSHETVQVMIEEMKKLREDGVTQDELDRAKVQLKSELVMRGESGVARMAALARSWWFEEKILTIQELKEAIDSVTTDQILGLLKRFPPMQPLVIGAIGPKSREELIGNALNAR